MRTHYFQTWVDFDGEELKVQGFFIPGFPGNREEPPEPPEIQETRISRADGSVYHWPADEETGDRLYNAILDSLEGGDE